ncbi:hypothetical protein DCAR_0415529 [Daucus carota subsp. sativus]|uniref:DUF7653 domain-containing protein n=1 Tax=Daucus carota subsp. sativus TaxID=79200 RepID=A0A165WDA5_DAUCS|nr:PREDICTED: myosin-13-like [Daucus carota subsp. sativus]XP_017244046.1 PREDICTED: myosin-13-like [Daucus carota subsp. sativus]WOG96196.1 hypothetical protein DCAR_0415529 [Daucus carota subsp. sativus]
MKKLLFFRSSTSNNGNDSSPPLSNDKQSYLENSSHGGRKAIDKVKTKKQVSGNQKSSISPSLRRSRSYSSGSIHEGGLGQTDLCFSNYDNGSPCHSIISRNQSDLRSSRFQTLSPERNSQAKWFKDASLQHSHVFEKPDGIISSRASFGSSESSSYCSSNVSSKVLDRYIVGEQLQETSVPKNTCHQKIRDEDRTGGGKRPPRVSIPTDGVNQKPRSQSFRETKESHQFFSTKDWVETGFGDESPRKLAKHVIERLSQARPLPAASSRKFDSDIPFTVEDIYGGEENRFSRLDSDGGQQKEISSLAERNGFCYETFRDPDSAAAEQDLDKKLLAKFEQAEERAMFLSEELKQENFLGDGRVSVHGLVQTIRSLAEERSNMALEVAAVLKDRVAEKASFAEELRLAKLELDSRTQKLEKEKNELQFSLEKELDRRSSEWSSKLEKYQSEEHRLRERVRELAEQNVSLQREASSFRERDTHSRNQIVSTEEQLQDLTTSIEQARAENQKLHKTIFEMQEKFRAAKDDRDCIHRSYEEKEKECKDFHRSVTRMLRTCSEQEKTIEGLRAGLRDEVAKQRFMDNPDSQIANLQMELMRLTGVEQNLRKEVESYRYEIDSLRHENINLLHRLKGGRNVNGSTFKLDQELFDCVCYMQNKTPTFLNECIQLCAKLLQHIKEKSGLSSHVKHGTEVIENGVDAQFIVDSDVRIQGFKRGAENLIQSLRSVSSVLQEKATTKESQQDSFQKELSHRSDQNLEDNLRSELRAEVLLTRLLRERLYSKELDIEQLQAEQAACVRGNDILQCEVQNALDTVSCVTHKMKDLELQMINKDENINRLQHDLQECRKELTIVRGILPKVSEERDLMWDKVKQYSENNMLLNSEVNDLKKKVENLDEEILLKEGQITILKDSMGKPFDLLASPDLDREFLLE